MMEMVMVSDPNVVLLNVVHNGPFFDSVPQKKDSSSAKRVHLRRYHYQRKLFPHFSFYSDHVFQVGFYSSGVFSSYLLFSLSGGFLSYLLFSFSGVFSSLGFFSLSGAFTSNVGLLNSAFVGSSSSLSNRGVLSSFLRLFF